MLKTNTKFIGIWILGAILSLPASADFVGGGEPVADGEECRNLPVLKAFEEAAEAANRHAYLRSFEIRSAEGQQSVSRVMRSTLLNMLRMSSTEESLLGYGRLNAGQCPIITLGMYRFRVIGQVDGGNRITLLHEPDSQACPNCSFGNAGHMGMMSPLRPVLINLELRVHDGYKQIIWSDTMEAAVMHACPNIGMISERGELEATRMITWGERLPNRVSVDPSILEMPDFGDFHREDEYCSNITLHIQHEDGSTEIRGGMGTTILPPAEDVSSSGRAL